MTSKIEIVASASHKNGRGGMPYTVAIFDDPAESDTKLAVLFEEPGYCAVFSLEDLSNNEDLSGDWTASRYEERLRELLFPGETGADNREMD